MARNLMICANSVNSLHKLNESEDANGKKSYVLEGVFAELDKLNRNQRIYPKEEYLKHLQYLRNDIKSGESLLGELDHPEDRFEVKLKEASHEVIDLWYDEGKNVVMGKIRLLDTPNGKLAQSIVDQGIPLHISSRAAGTVNSDNTVSIQQIYTYDLVCKPGFAGAVLHRVNESAEAVNYTEPVREFLTNSIKFESMNAAPQYGFVNEDMSVSEIKANTVLRKEAKDIEINKQIEIDIKDMTKSILENANPDATVGKPLDISGNGAAALGIPTSTSEADGISDEVKDDKEKDDKSESCCDKKEGCEDGSCKDKKDISEEDDENNDDAKDDKKEDDKDGEGEEDNKSEKCEVEIIDVKGEFEEGDNKEDIVDVKGEYDENGDAEGDDNKEGEDEDKKDDDNSDDSNEDKRTPDVKKDDKDSAEMLNDKKDDEKEGEKDEEAEKKQEELDKANKDAEDELKDLKDHKEELNKKLDDILKAVEKKNKTKEESKCESIIMAQYPVSMMMNESNFAAFAGLNESQKSKVVAYLQDNNITDKKSINESWKNGIDYTAPVPAWLKYAPENYKALYESASDRVKQSLATTASYLIFESQYDINTFWENSGLTEANERRLLNESFINNCPKVNVEKEQNTDLPYGNQYIQQIADMASEYNKKY